MVDLVAYLSFGLPSQLHIYIYIYTNLVIYSLSLFNFWVNYMTLYSFDETRLETL